MGRTSARTPKKGRRRKTWQERFLEAFADTGVIKYAAEKAKVGRSTVYDERDRSPEFDAAIKAIEEWTTEEMEQEARRRAVAGVEEPIVRNGEIVGHVRRYSDTLLIFLLKARRPEVYRENVKIEHGGKVTHEIETALDARIDALMEELAARREAAPAAPAANGSVGANGANGAAAAGR